MSRAKKLLAKTKELENNIRKGPYKQRITLENIKEVEKIVYKEKENKDALRKTPQKSKEKETNAKTKKTKVLEELSEISSFEELKKIESFDDSPELESFDTTSTSIMRIDYRFPNEDYGIEMTLPSGIITASGLQPGDYLEVLEGELEGRLLEVIEVLNSNTLRLDDVPTYSKAEESCKIKFIFN